jgi:hypothetical protein
MIHNTMLSSKLATVDLPKLINEYGPPHFPTQRNPVGTLNENFWAALYATCNEAVFENRENGFWQFETRKYDSFSTHLLMDQIANDILWSAQNWPGYIPLAQLRNSRHVNGIIACLKRMIWTTSLATKMRERSMQTAASAVFVANTTGKSRAHLECA